MAHVVDVCVEVAPFEEDEEHEPTKDTHEEQHLGNELQYNVAVPLEVPVCVCMCACVCVCV